MSSLANHFFNMFTLRLLVLSYVRPIFKPFGETMRKRKKTCDAQMELVFDLCLNLSCLIEKYLLINLDLTVA